MKNNSKVLFILMGSRIICSSSKSLQSSSRIFDSSGVVPPGFEHTQLKAMWNCSRTIKNPTRTL